MADNISPCNLVLRVDPRQAKVIHVLADAFRPCLPGPTSASVADAENLLDAAGSSLDMTRPTESAAAEDGSHIVETQLLQQFIGGDLVTLINAADPVDHRTVVAT